MPWRTTSLIVTPREAAMTFSRWRSSFVSNTEMRTASSGSVEAAETGLERLRGDCWAMGNAKARVDAYTRTV